MPERQHDTRTLLDKIHRGFARNDLRLAKILTHWGIPDVSDEEVDRMLAEEGMSRPVKSPTAAPGQLSTGEPVVHSEPRATRPTAEEV